MTAYGRATVASPLGRFTVELQSVNRKHLEINSYLPKELLRYDADIKRWITNAVARGQINLKLHAVFDKVSPLVVTPNIALARQIKSAWELLIADLNLVVNDEGLLRILSNEDEILLYEEDLHDEEVFRKVLEEAISQALKQFIEMKLREGKTLCDDISDRFAKLGSWIKLIAVKAPGATERYRQKLLERLQEVLTTTIENDERILREVCVYADRIDIAEELTRFDSHLKQVDELLNADRPEGVGKTLEFLVQELNREINTISSKSSDVEVSRLVIDIKTELERIREQIQNIE